jgi:cell division protein FtsA
MEKIFALDLGTTKFCLALLGLQQKNSDTFIDTVTVNSQGMNRGMISDFYSAQKALATLLDLAEKEFNSRIDRVCLGVSGTHLKSGFVTAQLPIDNDRIVNPKTLEKIKDQIRNNHLNEKREFIHISPHGYQIDDREWLINPLGFSGSHLGAKYFVIEADKYYLADLVRLCNSCGVKVSRLVSEQYASSMVTVESSRKELGVVLLDIGGGTTDGMVFMNGKPSKVFTVNIGGNLMTKDLSIGLGVPFDEAERLKIIAGLSENSYGFSLEIRDLQGQICNIDPIMLFEILKARIVELAELVKREISSLKPLLQGGIILTGGGSEVIGISTVFQQILKMPVDKVDPVFKKTLDSSEISRLSSKYSTVLGLLYLEYIQRSDLEFGTKMRTLGSFYRLINWVKELY